MSSRLRSQNSSKISFFAFQDIITAVSGILILVTLILATDLERPEQSHTQDAAPELEHQLQKTFRLQMEADAQNHRLQELLAAAETAPAMEKLESDISQLRSQLAEERRRQTSITSQMAANQSAVEARDKTLGLTDLKNTIQRMLQDVASIVSKDAKARGAMDNLEQQVTRAQSRQLKLRQRDGQLWLIPDKSATSKEPILVTVAGSGARVERFDHPEERRQLGNASAVSEFESYLGNARTLDQYIVFLIKPSGIKLFQDLIKSARNKGFAVGFDALEEGREIHFSTPPVVDESTPPKSATADSAHQPTPNAATSNGGGTASPAGALPGATPQRPDKSPSATPTPAKDKSWWQRLLKFIGLG